MCFKIGTRYKLCRSSRFDVFRIHASSCRACICLLEMLELPSNTIFVDFFWGVLKSFEEFWNHRFFGELVLLADSLSMHDKSAFCFFECPSDSSLQHTFEKRQLKSDPDSEKKRGFLTLPWTGILIKLNLEN